VSLSQEAQNGSKNTPDVKPTAVAAMIKQILASRIAQTHSNQMNTNSQQLNNASRTAFKHKPLVRHLAPTPPTVTAQAETADTVNGRGITNAIPGVIAHIQMTGHPDGENALFMLHK
jgi:hypothetical protein